MAWLRRERQRRRLRSYGTGQVCAENLEARALLTTLVWSNAPTLPAAQTDAVAVVGADNAVHLLGGDSASPTAAPMLAANGTSWVAGQNIDMQRNDLGAVRSGSGIYLFGGTGNAEGSDEVLSYDLNGDSEDLAKMSHIRYDHGFAVDGGGRAYALGGIGVFEDGEIWAHSERYDRATGTWGAIAPLPVALRGMSAVGDGDGSIFVFGGSTTLDYSGISDTSYRYDIASDTWTTVGPMLTGTRDSAVVMDEHGTIYVTGGMTATGATDAVQSYDRATNSWTANAPLPAAVYSHAIAYDSLARITVAAGFDSSGTPTTAVHRSQRLDVAQSAPVITSAPVLNGSLDKPYTYDVDATGNPAPTFSLLTAPAGMTIDGDTGVIGWQPIDGQVGVHSVTVRAANVVGNVDQSYDIDVVADTIAPTVPADFAVQSATENTITLDWTASFDAVGVNHYEVSTAIYSGPRFGKKWRYTVVDTVPGDITTSTITGLTPLTSKRFSVQAFDAAGNASTRSPRVLSTTLAAPTLTFQYGSQTTGTIESPAKTPIEIRLRSQANPAPTFSIVSGPADMVVNGNTGVVNWTPSVADIALHTVVFRADNSVGSTDLSVLIDVIPDAPQLSIELNPGTGDQFALAGTLFTAQVSDGSSSPSTYSLVTAPDGMTIDSQTGLISWPPTGEQGGTQTVTVEGTNEGGSAQITRNVTTLFTGAVTNVAVTGTSLLEPTASWDAPTGEGAELVARYKIDGFAKWGAGRTRKTHRVSYTVAASETSVLMTGLVRGKSYALTITALNSTTDPGLANTGTSFVSSPALPQVRWTVNGFSDGLSVPGPVVAGQPAEIVLADQRPDPSDIELLSGPAGLTFDPTTKTAEWTPDAEDVNTGYTNTNVTFRATNTVGSVDITVPVHVYFSGAVKNLQATKYGTVAASASWDAPTDNVTPIAGYRVTMHWTWSGRRRSRSWTVDGDVTSISYSLVPTGAVSHKGVSITPIDTDDNFGVDSGKVLYGQRANNLPPIAVNDAYDVTEDTTLNVDFFSGIRANDIDTDNTPFFNPLSARLVSGPANGTLSLNTLGSFDYIPDANFNGVDTFTYLVNDGKFDSNVATVTLNVAAVNDTPSALDDYYTVDQDGSLTVGVATGVQANDSDVDGGTLTASVVANPTNGSVTLSGDGSFVYTPAVGFTGDDTFTYVVNDTLVDSRVATVNITVNATAPPPPPGTRFYVVDFSGRATFEYDTTGDLVETYALPKANKKPLGVAANADGSLVWTIDKQKRVFIYDDSGTRLGMWVPEGLTKPDGIATDGTDIWIVDRSADKVLYYADGAARRNGTAAPTSDFALDRTNRNPKGITSDGTSVWIVNDTKNADRVFRYDTTGSLLGRWKIDSLNAKPTGITIDPNNVNDLWVVDSSADSVFQYSSAATRLKGTQTADVVFELDNANTNPQGIADPKPSGTQAVSRTSVALEVIRPDQSSIFVSQPERNRLARTTIKRQFPTAQRGSLEPRLSLDGPVLADPRVGLGAAHDQMLLDTLFARSSDFLAILDSQMVID